MFPSIGQSRILSPTAGLHRVVGPLFLCLACILAASCESVHHSIRSSADSVIPVPPTPAPAMFREEPDIRVRVLSAISSARVDGPPRIILRAADTDASLGNARTLTGPISVSSSSNGFRVTDARGGSHDLRFGVDIELIAGGDPSISGEGNKEPGRSWEDSIRVNGVRYPGFVAFRGRWSTNPNSFDAVAVMPIEAYLPGVLTHEIGKDWPRQAFEAQAVAARTYALHERSRARRDRRPFDVESTTSDQVYAGGTFLPIAAEAARATRGMVLLHNASLLRAYYSSTCGGRPASASLAWPERPGTDFNKAPPLQGRPRPFACRASKHFRWVVERSDEDLSRRIRAWGKTYDHPVADLSRVRSVSVKSVNDAGRPSRYAVFDLSGREFSLSAEELRAACNHNATGLPPISDKTRVLSGDMEIEVWADRARIQGRGWGHGVGMCQFCAKGFAEQGSDWASMMKEFYPGADVRKAY